MDNPKSDRIEEHLYLAGEDGDTLAFESPNELETDFFTVLSALRVLALRRAGFPPPPPAALVGQDFFRVKVLFSWPDIGLRRSVWASGSRLLVSLEESVWLTADFLPQPAESGCFLDATTLGVLGSLLGLEKAKVRPGGGLPVAVDPGGRRCRGEEDPGGLMLPGDEVQGGLEPGEASRGLEVFEGSTR